MSIASRKLGDELMFLNGKAPTIVESGSFPVFGSNGIIGRSEEHNFEHAVILGRVGAYCGSVEMCSGKFWASDNTIVVKPLKDGNTRYLYYLLKNSPLRSYAGGAAQPLITHGILRGIPVKVADRPTQDKIAAVLSAYDDLIANNERRIVVLDRLARLLYEEWFVHFRYPGRKQSNTREPEWESVRLAEIAETNRESYSSKSLPREISYIDISSVKSGRINARTSVSASEAPGRARRIARDGDIIWSNVRPNLRQHALILRPEVNDVFSTGFTILTPTKVPFSFLYVATTTDTFVARLVNFTTGASYPAVRPEVFESASLLLPPKELLDAYHTLCEPLFRQAKILADQIDRLSTARDLLLPRLLDGRIAV